jgi:hypothetical protein
MPFQMEKNNIQWDSEKGLESYQAVGFEKRSLIKA